MWGDRVNRFSREPTVLQHAVNRAAGDESALYAVTWNGEGLPIGCGTSAAVIIEGLSLA